MITLVSGDFTTWGGMDRANYELAWHLASQGMQVNLIAYHVAEPLAENPNVRWQRVAKPLNSYTLGAHLLARRGRAAAASTTKQDGRTIVNGGNCLWPDINWVHAAQVAWKHRTEYAPFHARIRQSLSRAGDARREGDALRMAKVVIVNSNRTREVLMRELEVPSDRVHTVYYGTDPEVFRPATAAEKTAARVRLGWPAERLTAAFVGALGYDRHKGFDVLFAAWKLLCANPAWDVDLVAAGGGAEVSHWRSQIAQAGLSGRIHMLGFTRNVPEVLRASDLLVHPTFYESYGLSVHEALCCGVPAIVTRCAGVAERYPQNLSHLLLDDPPTADNLVDRLREWRANWEGHRVHLQMFSSKLRQRTWADMAREFVEIAMPEVARAPALA